MNFAVRLFTAVVLAGVLAGPAMAQCNPSYDPLCGETPGAGPDVGISPDGGSHEVDPQSETRPTVTVTVVFTDPDGVKPETLKLELWNAGSGVPVTLATQPTSDVSTLRLKGNVTLQNAGENVLVAQLADRLGNVGSSRATFRLTYLNPNAPVISPDSHHNEYRDTTTGAFTLPYEVASYTSGGVQRTVSLVYNSEHARPTVTARIDARPDPRSGQQVIALSLRMQYWTADGSPGTQLGRESYYQKGVAPFQRLAWQSNTSSLSGGYRYAAVVRSHFADGGVVEKRHFVRSLLINGRNSRYGFGWSVGGVQRLHNANTPDGFVLNEGNGIARFFAAGSCGANECAYVTPEGDFTRLVYRPGSKTYLRTYPDGSTVTFSEQGLMTHVTDRVGNTTAFEWQQTQDTAREWVLARIVDPIGHAVTFAYGADWYLRSITSPGRAITFTHDAARDLTTISGPSTVKLTYYDDHLLSSYAIAADGTERKWDVAYDGFRRLSSVTSPAVTVGGVLKNPVMSYRSLQSLTIPPGGTGTSLMNPFPAVPSDQAYAETKDAGRHSTRTLLDRYDRPTKIVTEHDTVEMWWTRDGLLATEGRATEVTTYAWNNDGQLLARAVNDGIVYAAAYSGGLRTYENDGGVARWYAYGLRGELLRSWSGAQADWNRTATTYDYNARYQIVRATGPKGEKTEWSYEGNPWRNADSMRVTREDGMVETTSFTYDARSRVRTQADALHDVTTIDYDDFNRKIRITQSDGKFVSHTYTGPFLTRVTDRAGKSFEYAYNALGWLESELLPGSNLRRTYQYDIDGLLLSHTDRRGATVTMTYDASHRTTSRVADGQTTSFTFPDPYTETVTSPESIVQTRISAAHNRIDSLSSTLGPRRYELQWVRDDATNYWRDLGLDLKIYLNGTLERTDSIRYSSNFTPPATTAGSTHSIVDFSGRTSVVTLDTAGRPERIAFGNGVDQTNTFTAEGRLQATHFNVPAVDDKLGATYTYDLLGRLGRRTTSAGTTAWQYAYDSLGRLIEYKRSTSVPIDCNPAVQDCTTPARPSIALENYAYDAAGNRTDRGAVVEPGSNRYTSFDGYSLEYDAEGHLTRKYKTGFEQRMTWNASGQLASVTTNGVTVTYGYDGLGRRVRRTENGESRYFLYDREDLRMETDGSGAPLRTYTYWPAIDRPHSVRVTSGGRSDIYYYALDHPNNVAGLLDVVGGLAAEYRYKPFGELESAADSIGQPLRFMGRELDFRTGLYYVRNRWYDASLARFVSEDPAGAAGGLNTYTYADNDPINKTDPSGLTPCRLTIHFTPQAWTEIGRELGHEERKDLFDELREMGVCLVVDPEFMLKEAPAFLYDPHGILDPAIRNPVTINFEMSYPGPTIGPGMPREYRMAYEAAQAARCQRWRRWAAGWRLLHLAGDLRGLNGSAGSPQIDGGEMGSAFGTTYADAAEQMAAIVCSGRLGLQ
jgi:RHS repeat-associated protein